MNTVIVTSSDLSKTLDELVKWQDRATKAEKQRDAALLALAKPAPSADVARAAMALAEAYHATMSWDEDDPESEAAYERRHQAYVAWQSLYEPATKEAR